MPCGHGRSTSVQKTVDRRCRSASKRSIFQSNHEECQVPELALKNIQHRWYTCTIIFLQDNENWKLLPVLPLLQGTDPRNYSESGASINMDNLESKSPRGESCTEVDLSNQRAESAKMILCVSPVSVKILEESEGADKSKLHNDSSSTSLSKHMVSCNPSGSVNDDFSSVGLDFLVDSVPKANKQLKRNKKKGKKKGKQFKKTASKKNSSESDVCRDEGSSNVSFVEVSMENFNSSVSNHVSDDIAVPTICPISNSKTEKDDIRNDNSSITLVSSASCGDAMDESEGVDPPQSLASNIKTSTIQSPELILSNYVEDNIDAQCKEDASLRHSSCGVAVNGFSSSAVDSSLDDWNGDISENYSDDTEIGLTSKEEERTNSSEGEGTSVSANFDASFSTRTMNMCIAEGEMSNDGNPYQSSNTLNVCSDTDRADCSSQACSSNGFHPVISGKRARRARKMTGNGKSECTNRLGAGNSHGRAGRDNVYSVWQKVEKTNTEKPSRFGNHEIASTRDGETSRHKIKLDTSVQFIEKAGKSCRYPGSQVMSKKATCQTVTSAVKSDQTVVKSAAGNYANNVKGQLSSVSKKANNSFRSDSSADVSKVAKPLKYHVKKKEALPLSSLGNDTKSRNTTLASVIIPPALVNQADKRDYCESKLEQDSSVSADLATSSSIASSIACGKNIPSECSEQFPRDYNLCKKPIPINSESNGSPTWSIDMHVIPIQYYEDSPSTYSESESSNTEASNVDNSAAVLFQKSMHLGIKGAVTKNMLHANRLDADVANEAVLDSSGPKNSKVDKYVSISSSIDTSTYSGSCSRDAEFSFAESVESTISFRSHSYLSDEIGDLSNDRTGRVKDQEICGFQTDLDKIRRFAFDAYKLQITTENAQSTSRTLITDVERFVYSASPVILHTDHRKRCMICPQEELISQSLCRHQIPDISLRNLWCWYEEPGCFGLEVKAQDHFHSKDFRKGSGFNAYFVPYLSAVQLFAKSWSADYQDPQVEMAMPACGTSIPVSSCPTFSMPLHLSKDANLCIEELSSSVQDELVDQSAHSKVSDGDLLFEYFESEQPPRRHPLYEKIKELVSGQTSPNTRIFGDPRKLESVKLRDLHPASWYCVAWYPIYCIPDGNFRASFLTYHSLGCLIERDFSNNSHDHRSIASPVVGLQTYNVKGESWFQPRNSDSKPVDPSQLIKERLRALKETAAVMATAVVSKGGQRSVNHHPDYQFFHSRASRAPFNSS